MPGTFSPPPRVNDPDMHHGTCVTHVPWCMPGSLTSSFLWSRWRGKRSRHSWRMRNPHFYVSGKRPIGQYPAPQTLGHDRSDPFSMVVFSSGQKDICVMYSQQRQLIVGYLCYDSLLNTTDTWVLNPVQNLSKEDEYVDSLYTVWTSMSLLHFMIV